MLIRYTLLFLSVVLVSCSATKGKKLLKAGYVKAGNTDIKLADTPTDSVTLHYFECGGFYIEHNGQALLIDPFASNPKAMGRIKPNPAAVDSVMHHATGLQRGQPNKIGAVLVGHAHYDHFMDVPYILDNWVDTNAWFAGNNTASKIVRLLTTKSIGPTVNLDAYCGELYVGKDIRITPILIDHPPHFGKTKLFPGEFKDGAKPWQKQFWTCGQVYGYIIDYLDTNNRVTFRILMQTSGTLLALDNAPPGIMRQRNIDLMIIPAALYTHAKGYPQRLISQLHPKHVIACHWEDFFKPMDKLRKNPSTVSLTNVYQFAKLLDYNIGRSHFTIPMPDTKIKVRF